MTHTEIEAIAPLLGREVASVIMAQINTKHIGICKGIS